MRKQSVGTGSWNSEEANGWFGRISNEFVSQSYVDTTKAENKLRRLWLTSVMLSSETLTARPKGDRAKMVLLSVILPPLTTPQPKLSCFTLSVTKYKLALMR